MPKQLINRIKSDPGENSRVYDCFSQAFPETASKLSADIVTGTEHKDSIADGDGRFYRQQGGLPYRQDPLKQYEKQKNADMGKDGERL